MRSDELSYRVATMPWFDRLFGIVEPCDCPLAGSPHQHVASVNLVNFGPQTPAPHAAGQGKRRHFWQATIASITASVSCGSRIFTVSMPAALGA